MNKTPKLRFKEFSGNWDKKRLSEIASIKGGYAFKSKEFSNYKDKYQVIKMGNLYQNQLLLDRSPSYKKEITEKEEQYLLKSGDIIITLTGTVGKKDFGYSYRISDEKNLLLNQRLGLIRNKENISDDRFLKYTVLDKFFLDQFFESSVGGTGNQANVSTKNMEEFYVYSPKLEEQEKIASFFSLIDDKIFLQGEKVEALKDYKKGMMQKIFSRELRFKDDDGRDYPEWEEKKLEEVSDVLSGKRVPKGMSLVEYNTNIPYITVSDMGNKYVNTSNLRYITSEIEEYIKKYKVIENDIIISVAGTLGKINVIHSDLENANLTENCDKITNFKGVYYKYVYYYLNTDSIQNQIQSVNTISSQPKLALNCIRDFDIFIPSYDEQNKIASFLESIDLKLEKEQQKLDSLNEYKKGLLQQMFV